MVAIPIKFANEKPQCAVRYVRDKTTQKIDKKIVGSQNKPGVMRDLLPDSRTRSRLVRSKLPCHCSSIRREHLPRLIRSRMSHAWQEEDSVRKDDPRYAGGFLL